MKTSKEKTEGGILPKKSEKDKKKQELVKNYRVAVFDIETHFAAQPAYSLNINRIIPHGGVKNPRKNTGQDWHTVFQRVLRVLKIMFPGETSGPDVIFFHSKRQEFLLPIP